MTKTASSASGRILAIREVASGYILIEGYLLKGESDDGASARLARKLGGILMNPSGWIADPHGENLKTGRVWIHFKLAILKIGDQESAVSIGISTRIPESLPVIES